MVEIGIWIKPDKQMIRMCIKLHLGLRAEHYLFDHFGKKRIQRSYKFLKSNRVSTTKQLLEVAIVG